MAPHFIDVYRKQFSKFRETPLAVVIKWPLSGSLAIKLSSHFSPEPFKTNLYTLGERAASAASDRGRRYTTLKRRN